MLYKTVMLIVVNAEIFFVFCDIKQNLIFWTVVRQNNTFKFLKLGSGILWWTCSATFWKLIDQAINYVIEKIIHSCSPIMNKCTLPVSKPKTHTHQCVTHLFKNMKKGLQLGVQLKWTSVHWSMLPTHSITFSFSVCVFKWATTIHFISSTVRPEKLCSGHSQDISPLQRRLFLLVTSRSMIFLNGLVIVVLREHRSKK